MDCRPPSCDHCWGKRANSKRCHRKKIEELLTLSWEAKTNLKQILPTFYKRSYTSQSSSTKTENWIRSKARCASFSPRFYRNMPLGIAHLPKGRHYTFKLWEEILSTPTTLQLAVLGINLWLCVDAVLHCHDMVGSGHDCCNPKTLFQSPPI